MFSAPCVRKREKEKVVEEESFRRDPKKVGLVADLAFDLFLENFHQVVTERIMFPDNLLHLGKKHLLQLYKLMRHNNQMTSYLVDEATIDSP